jgi:hypothetical protein
MLPGGMRRGLVALAFVAAAACGGAPSTTATSPTGNASTATPGTQATATSSPSGNAFRNITSAGANTPYKVTYQISSSAGGQAFGTSQTWYVSGKNFRMDLSIAPGTSISVFVVPEGSYTCITGTGTAAQCSSTPGGAAFAQSPAAGFDADIRANPDAYGAIPKEARTIAGTSASCYGLAGTGTGFTQGTVCYTSSGVPLFQQFDAAGLSFTMEATAFGVPSDADFKLPAPPR